MDLGSIVSALESAGYQLVLGPRAWVFYLIVGGCAIIAVYLRTGFKKQVKIEEWAPDVPSAEEYLKRDIEPRDFPPAGTEPITAPAQAERPGLDRPAVYDPSMEKISLAFDSAKERMIDEFASAITRMKFKITLPEEGKPVKVEAESTPEASPPEGD